MNQDVTKKPPTTARSVRQERRQIRLRAYELYEARGREDGHELEDWLRAEEEITQKAEEGTHHRRLTVWKRAKRQLPFRGGLCWMTSVLVPRKPSNPRQTRGVSFVGMAQAFARSGRPRRRGNPNWGSGQPPRPAFAAPTEFEIQVRQLELTKQTCADSTEFRRCAVWEIQVDPSFLAG